MPTVNFEIHSFYLFEDFCFPVTQNLCPGKLLNGVKTKILSALLKETASNDQIACMHIFYLTFLCILWCPFHLQILPGVLLCLLSVVFH